MVSGKSCECFMEVFSCSLLYHPAIHMWFWQWLLENFLFRKIIGMSISLVKWQQAESGC